MKSAISFLAIRASGSMPVNMTGLKVAKSCGLLDISVSSAELSKRRQAHAGDMRAINRRVRALRSLASARRRGILS